MDRAPLGPAVSPWIGVRKDEMMNLIHGLSFAMTQEIAGVRDVVERKVDDRTYSIRITFDPNMDTDIS